ncbi:MAG TPA: hypothetical protein VG963_27905 [Polyangiaceae bacterium]|nr:hypothetical protein [Polyangiaceae bacterium]
MSREFRDLLVKSAPDLEEKGGGLIPKGGSSRLQRRMQGIAYGLGGWGDGGRVTRRGLRAHVANKYLSGRTGRNMFGATPPRLTPRGAWRTGKYR